MQLKIFYQHQKINVYAIKQTNELKKIIYNMEPVKNKQQYILIKSKIII